MTHSVVAWTVAAVLLFWTVGAYNRLMRLRAEAKSAFEVLEAEMSRQIDLVRKELPPPDPVQPASFETQPYSFWTGLHAAAAQYAASLGDARGKPLDREVIAALAAAQKVMAMAWDRAERDDAHDLAGPRLPDTLLTRRAQLALKTHSATDHFNRCVDKYNAGIAQFPAVLLAWLFGFKPAGVLPQATGLSIG